MSDVKVTLGADASELKREIETAARHVRRFENDSQVLQGRIGELAGRLQMTYGPMSRFSSAANNGSESARGMWESLKAGEGALAGVSAGFSGAIAGATALAAATLGAQKVLETYGGYDSLVRGLLNVEGSAEATRARLLELKKVAKLPGLGFEEAVQGDIRLRAAGISAATAKASLLGFANALASVGKGKGDLEGVILALTQISAKGKVTAEDINQIAERVPQIRKIMKDAFGTADTESLQKMGMTGNSFIEGIVAGLEKLPKVSGGAQNALENFEDSWKSLRTTATEFAVEMSSNWINDVSRAFNQAEKLVTNLKNSMGVDNKALKDADRRGDAKNVEEDPAIAAKAEALAASARLEAENAAYAQRLDAQRIEGLKRNAEKQVVIEQDAIQRIRKAQESVNKLMLDPEADTLKRLNEAKSRSLFKPEEINSIRDLSVKADAAENAAEVLALEKSLKEIRSQKSAEAARTALIAAQEAESRKKEEEIKIQQQVEKAAQAAQELAGRNEVLNTLKDELEISRLMAKGENQKAEMLKQQIELRKEAKALALATGKDEKQIMNILLEKQANLQAAATRASRSSETKRHFNAAESAARRAARVSARDRTGRKMSNTDKLAIENERRREQQRADRNKADAKDAASPGDKILQNILEQEKKQVEVWEKITSRAQ